MRVLTGEELVVLAKGFTVLVQNVAPVANPGGPYSGNVGQTITFNAKGSTAPSGQTITAYAWNFGDGSTGTGATPTHAYASAGTFTVSLTVTDTSGGTNAASTTAVIAALPVAKPGGPYSGNVGQTITFNGTGSAAPTGQTITAYAWNFGDSSTATGATPTHAYTTGGTFTVTLTVTDTTGGMNTASTTATIAALPGANPGGPYTGNVGQTITFNGTGSTAPSGQTITAYAWNFGDGSTGTGATPSHAYASAGTFTVSLTVTDTSGGTNTATTTATIGALPVANAGGPYTGNVGQTITFNGTGSTAPTGQTITAYAWNFGDSSTGTGASPTHAYASAGTFTVSLTVTDTSGGTNTATTTATIGALPVANPGGPYTGTVNQAVSFNGTGSTAPTGQTITAYAWNFGDSSTGTGASPTHTYASAGTFTVSLMVTDTSGGTNTASSTATITSQSGPLAITGFSPASGPIGTLVSVALSNFTPVQGSAPQVTLAATGGGIISAPVSSFTTNALSFVVPDGAATGTIIVASGGQTAVSSGTFSITTSSTFTIAIGPSTANLIQGQQVSYAVTLSTSTVFSQLATLSVTGLPSGVTSVFQPAVITTGQTSALTLSAPATQATGTSSLSVSASATIDGQTVTQSATASLQVTTVTTSFLGRTVVDDSQRTPIGGVTVKFLGKDDKGNITGCSGQTASDVGGNFSLTSLPASCIGPQLIAYDGSTATSPTGKFAGVNLSYTLTSGQVTTSPVLIHLPRIDNAETVQVQQNSSTNQVFTFQSIPGLVVTVYAGTTFSLADGSQPTPFPLIAIEVPVDRLPDTMPTSGTLTPFIVAFQPANAVASQPVAVNFPNSLNIPPGQTATLMTLDPTRGYMVPYGTGTVSSDGTKFIADPDPAHPGHGYGLVHFDWHGWSANAPPPKKCPPGACICRIGKPIDPSSGIAVVEETDIAVNGSRGPISIVRTFRSRSTNAGPFGLGTNHNYGYQLDVANYIRGTALVMNLLMPDGNQFPFSQQPNGTFVNSTIPSLRGAAISIVSTGIYDLRWKDGTLFQFEASPLGPLLAFLSSIKDTNGNAVTLFRNPAQPLQIAQITDPVGRSLTVNYDTSNRITSIVDPVGRTVSYTYNSQGTLATVTDPQGGVTLYNYDPQNNLTQETDARGVVIAQNTYDTNGRVVQQVQADGGIIKFAYTLLNPMVPNSPVLLTTVTDAQGNQTSYRYNPAGFVMDVTDAAGQIRSFNRQSGTNQLLSITGTAVCNVCGASGAGDQSFTYDANGNLLTQTDALGNTTAFTYDPVFNKVTSILDASGKLTRFTYDSQGNLVTTTDANGNITALAYDSFGQLTQVTDPLGHKTTLAHDSVGNLISTTDPLGNTTSTFYDEVSRLIQVRDAVGRVTQTAYDPLDRVITRTDAQNGSTRFTYDTVGNLLSVTDAKGNKTSFVYDPMSRLVGRTDPLGKADTRNYDFNGNLINFVDRRGQTSQFTYDPRNRLVGENYQDGSTVGRSYDATGRLLHVVDSVGGVFDFSYDLDGHLKSSATQFGTVQYSYDATGRVTSHQVAGQAPLQYSYDAVGNLLTAALSQAAANFAYDARNEILSLNRSNGVSTAYTYDADGSALSITHSGANGLLDAESYTYDAVGNRSASTKGTAQPLVTQPVNNLYDIGNRLVQSTSANGTTAYSYDNNGNLISAVSPIGTTTYTWDSRNRLRTISAPNGQTTTFLYDFDGSLISQKDSGPSLNLTQTFVLDDRTNVAWESKSDGTQFSLLSGRSLDQQLAVIHSNGQIEYPLTDGVNSTIATVDQSGTVRNQLFYEPFGQTTSTSGASPFEFTGRIPVTATLYNYRGRYYDSSVGRFISEDPIGFDSGDLNLYRYASNSPIMLVDATGLTGIGCHVACELVFYVACEPTGPGELICHLASIKVCHDVCKEPPPENTPPPPPIRAACEEPPRPSGPSLVRKPPWMKNKRP